MTVVPFIVRPPDPGFNAAELEALSRICAPAVASGASSGFELGVAENGDPQAYFVGGPDHDCVLCISRVGRRYVVEDGSGGVLAEEPSMRRVSEYASRLFRERKAGVVARIAALWYAAREFFEEKVEPVLAEPIEIATHFAPQLAALV